MPCGALSPRGNSRYTFDAQPNMADSSDLGHHTVDEQLLASWAAHALNRSPVCKGLASHRQDTMATGMQGYRAHIQDPPWVLVYRGPAAHNQDTYRYKADASTQALFASPIPWKLPDAHVCVHLLCTRGSVRKVALVSCSLGCMLKPKATPQESRCGYILCIC